VSYWRKGSLLRPFCHLSLSASRHDSSSFLKLWRSLGKLIHKRRLDLNLSLAKCSQKLGIAKRTLQNWEANRTKPLSRCFERISGFVGRDPFEGL
jgi:ribosome-binding protein aMBF1 (putative translation factor)